MRSIRDALDRFDSSACTNGQNWRRVTLLIAGSLGHATLWCAKKTFAFYKVYLRIVCAAAALFIGGALLGVVVAAPLVLLGADPTLIVGFAILGGWAAMCIGTPIYLLLRIRSAAMRVQFVRALFA